MKGLKSDNYSVYIHTCPNGKVYVGITSLDVNYRWRSMVYYGLILGGIYL